ncbi:recombinase RecT [Paenibacillus sp. MMO-58]|uniref:recombinase RecT n=1 Tax=Paenibacillus sp. MMO-58 TaxID=3081290 RepID=UPI00301A6320
MTQLALYQSYAFGELLPEDVKTIHETIAKDCNESQFRLFMAVAKAADANPIMGEIHPTVYNGKLTWQFAVDYHLKKSKQSNGYKGYDVQIVHEHDIFKMHQEQAEDGRYYAVIDEHSWSFPRGRQVGGYAVAYREGMAPFTVVMDVEEVEHYKKSNIGMQKTMWTNNFNDMFKKHMVKRALKAAFGAGADDSEDGIGEGAGAAPDPYERRDITAEANGQQPAPEVEPEKPKNKPTRQADTSEPNDVDPIQAKWDEVGALFAKLGITDKKAQVKYLEDNLRIKGESANVAELTGLVKLMTLELEAKSDDLE